MKKKFIIVTIVCVVIAILGGIVVLLFSSNKPNVGQFDLSNYQWAIDKFPLDKNVGKVDNAETAIEKAKEVWIEKFNTINGETYNPINGKPIKVYFDSKNDCWYLHGALPKNWIGGVPGILIKSNGDVLAVWHSQ